MAHSDREGIGLGADAVAGGAAGGAGGAIRDLNTPRAPRVTRRPCLRSPAKVRGYLRYRLHAMPASPTRPEPRRSREAGFRSTASAAENALMASRAGAAEERGPPGGPPGKQR